MNVLVLAPHTDDAELCCGGTMAALSEHSVTVAVLASVTPEGETHLRTEFSEAMRVYGCEYVDLGMTIRTLRDRRQDVLDALCMLRDEYKPDVVFMPADGDLHQDHLTVHREGMRAFRSQTVYGYGLPHNHPTFTASAFFTLGEAHLDKQMEALKCYRSQRHRPYMHPHFIRALAIVRGGMVGQEYAEAFTAYRVVSHSPARESLS